MSNRTVRDMLAAQADALTTGQNPAQWLPPTAESEDAAVRALMQLAERTRDALSPVQPNPAFVRQLSQQLIVTASESRQAVTRRTRNTLLLLAEMLGSAVFIAAALAIMIHVLRRRPARRAAHRAAHRAPAQT